MQDCKPQVADPSLGDFMIFGLLCLPLCNSASRGIDVSSFTKSKDVFRYLTKCRSPILSLLSYINPHPNAGAVAFAHVIAAPGHSNHACGQRAVSITTPV